MNDTVNLGVFCEDIVESFLIGEVHGVELRTAATEDLDAVEGDLRRVVEVVNDHHVVAMLKQSKGGEGADVARTTTIEKLVSVVMRSMLA